MAMRMLVVGLLLLQGQEEPKRDPARDALSYLLKHQGADGSWGGFPGSCTCLRGRDPEEGGDLESTAWAILAFAGAGYTELYKDELFGKKVGPLLASAMTWLLSKQDSDGAFDRTRVEVNALAALALFEVFGMTLQRPDAAQKAFGWIRRSKPEEGLAGLRLGMAWESAKLAERAKESKEELRGIAKVLEAGASRTSKIGAVMVRAFAEFPRKPSASKIDYKAFDPLGLSAEECNVLATAWSAMDGWTDWHEWYFGLRKNLGALQRKEDQGCESGSWEGGTLRERLRTTALRCLTMEHYRCNFCRGGFGRPK